MRAVVTGGCGFIGSNLAEELSKFMDVVVLDNLSTGKSSNLEGIDVEFVKGDILDFDLLKKIFKDSEYVFHLAAIVSVQESVDNPVLANEVNIRGTLNILEAARFGEVKKIIYSSSCAVYGDSEELPLKEESLPRPKSPYAVSKLAAENYCKVFSEIYGLKTVSLRYFNVYGPRQDPFSDYAAVIPRFISKALKGESPIIYGDGEQTRDFIYVRDVVKANILAMEKGEGVYNIASGKSITINELAKLVIRMVGAKTEPVYEEEREGDIRHSVADISKAKELGFSPSYTLEEGIKETIDYWRDRL
ncbi:MAG: SDR family oxidoreductase [Archaeoglobus sp.]|nr:SDR family oxidoreductase [Archaeoglobus sp.]